jgi:hypothetical protein
MIPYNQAMECKWRWESWDRVAFSQGYQVELGLYMASKLKTMRSGSKQQASDFKTAGRANFYSTVPQAVTADWDHLQALDVKRTVCPTTHARRHRP